MKRVKVRLHFPDDTFADILMDRTEAINMQRSGWIEYKSNKTVKRHMVIEEVYENIVVDWALQFSVYIPTQQHSDVITEQIKPDENGFLNPTDKQIEQLEEAVNRLHQSAKDFLAVYPDCPYTEKELIVLYHRRFLDKEM